MRRRGRGRFRSLVILVGAGALAAVGTVGFTAAAAHAATSNCAVTDNSPTDTTVILGSSSAPITVNGCVIVTSPGSITIGGDATITGDVTLSAGGPITFENGSKWTLTGGSASLAAGGEIDLQSGTAFDAQAGPVTLQGPTTLLEGALDSPSVPSLTGGTGTGNDSFTVDCANGASLPHGLSVTGGSGTNTLAVSDAGENLDHTYDVDPTTVVRDSAPPITYSNIGQVDVTGGHLSDGNTFNVTPSANTGFDLDGDTPLPLGGSSLSVNIGGTTSPTLTTGPAAGSGEYTFGNRQPISYDDMALVSPVPPTITSPASTTFTEGSPGSFTVTATGPPPPALTESGGLPGDVTFVDNGNGSATLSGTPASGSAGTYPLVISANDGLPPNAAQKFSLVVVGPVLQSISVTPAAETLGPGMTQQYTATGHYSDGTTKDLTSAVTWSSSDPRVASVSPTGLATIPEARTDFSTTTITATLAGQQGTASLTASQLRSIAVQPTISHLMVGGTEQLRAQGHFANGATADITDQVKWSALPQSVASVSPQGLAQGRSPGGELVLATSFPAVGLAAIIVTR